MTITGLDLFFIWLASFIGCFCALSAKDHISRKIEELNKYDFMIERLQLYKEKYGEL